MLTFYCLQDISMDEEERVMEEVERRSSMSEMDLKVSIAHLLLEIATHKMHLFCNISHMKLPLTRGCRWRR